MSKQRSKKTKQADVVKKGKGKWYYSNLVKKHFFHPKNVLLSDPKPNEYDAEGLIGAPVCGDMMKMWIKVDPKTQKIKKLKWRTFGCATAIASKSIFSEMVTKGEGMTIEKALKITPNDIVKKLGGLPSIKIHCSVLADQAFKKTIENYYKKHKK
jgi:NifU-like protein involved in Fe-S cluster formation